MRWLDGIINSKATSLSKLSGNCEGQEGLACYSPWSYRESDSTEQLYNISLRKTEILRTRTTQKTSNSQSNIEKEEWNWRNQPA